VKANKELSYYYYHYTGQEDSRYRKELHKDAVLSADVFLPVWQVNRRRMPSDGKSSHCLWKGELKRRTHLLNIYMQKLLL
jgi:hypothetical protein